MSENRKEFERWKYIRRKSYDDTLTEALSSMFVRRGLPDDFGRDTGFIEEILLKNGCGAYVLNDKEGKYVFGACQLASTPDAYGFGKNAIVRCLDGWVKEYPDWQNDDSIVVAFNNPQRLPDFTIPRFSDMLTETEVSLISQLMNSRQHPIPIAADEKSRVAIEEALKDMDAGKLRTILSPNVTKTLVEMGIDARAIEVLNLSDPAASDHIQYIAKLRDDLLRWFWNQYGHNPESTGKMAQQSVAEVTTGASIAMIIPHTRYHERQIEAEQLRKKFGWDVTIEFSEPWQNAFAQCNKELNPEEAPEEGENDELSDDSTEAVVSGDEDGGAADEV